MDKKSDSVPIVFISYCWTSEEHKKWVLNLAERLVKHSGIEVILDRWHGTVGKDRYYFMEESIKKADRVLIICDENYCEKANNRKGGVGTETLIITPEVYSDTNQEKFIPISLSEKDGEYLLPNYFKSRFALGMIEHEKFEEAYTELERLIWNEPALVPPIRGKKPNFNPVKEAQEGSNDEKKQTVFNHDAQERIIWLLPRGFLLFTDITYQHNASWATVLSYYDYNGQWKHSTHYHKSYSDRWGLSIETQYRKLSIPKADWIWCFSPLRLLMDLREVKHKIDINNVVAELKETDYPVYYYSKQEPILLPEVPKEYKFEYDTGNIRDLIEEIEAVKKEMETDSQSLMNKAIRIRQRVYLECLNYLSAENTSFKFINEIIEDFNPSFSSEDFLIWLNKLGSVLNTTLEYEWKSMQTN